MKLKCTCKHESQDKMHGPQMRIHNELGKKDKVTTPEYRCTVCAMVRKA